jgi:hypothetical protein
MSLPLGLGCYDHVTPRVPTHTLRPSSSFAIFEVGGVPIVFASRIPAVDALVCPFKILQVAHGRDVTYSRYTPFCLSNWTFRD